MTCLVEGLYVKLTFLLREIWEETFPLCKKKIDEEYFLSQNKTLDPLSDLSSLTQISLSLSLHPQPKPGGRRSHAPPVHGRAQPRGAARSRARAARSRAGRRPGRAGRRSGCEKAWKDKGGPWLVGEVRKFSFWGILKVKSEALVLKFSP